MVKLNKSSIFQTCLTIEHLFLEGSHSVLTTVPKTMPWEILLYTVKILLKRIYQSLNLNMYFASNLSH